MTSTEIAEKLSCIPEKDIELLTGMMLAAKSGDDRRLLIDMLDRADSGEGQAVPEPFQGILPARRHCAGDARQPGRADSG